MRVLLTGATGKLGAYLLRHLLEHGERVTAWRGTHLTDLFGVSVWPVDLTDEQAVVSAFRAEPPDLILHTAAMALISDCHRDPERARRVNGEATARLTELAAEHKARLVFVSTDLVFDGRRGGYREEDIPNPLSIYGRTKFEAESVVRTTPRAVVVRVSLLYGPCLTGRPSFFDDQTTALREGRSVKLFTDEWRTPLGLATAARALVAIAKSDVTGLLHLGGPERLSRLEMGRRLAAFLGVDTGKIQAVRRDEIPSPEPRPCDTSLNSSQWRSLFPHEPWPTWEESLREMAVRSSDPG